MIANVIILLLVFGYCGLVIYWKRTGVLKDSCSSCGSAHAHHMDSHKAAKKH